MREFQDGGKGMKRDKVDALFSHYIKLLSGGICKRCNHYLGIKSRGLHAAHCFSRGRKSTRFERDNCQALCYGCHRYLDQHPLEKAEFFLNILGQARYKELALLADKPRKLDLEAIEADLKEKIGILEQ